MAVGIFDFGLGELTVSDAVKKRLPDVPFVYFGHSADADAAYGVRAADNIYNLTTRVVECLWDNGCDLVIWPVTPPRLRPYAGYKKAGCRLTNAFWGCLCH